MRTPATQTPIPVAAIPEFDPDLWLYQVFSPLAVAGGVTLRREVAEVEAQIGSSRFLAEAVLRGYRVRKSAGEFVLTPAREPIRVAI